MVTRVNISGVHEVAAAWLTRDLVEGHNTHAKSFEYRAGRVLLLRRECGKGVDSLREEGTQDRHMDKLTGINS